MDNNYANLKHDNSANLPLKLKILNYIHSLKSRLFNSIGGTENHRYRNSYDTDRRRISMPIETHRGGGIF